MQPALFVLRCYFIRVFLLCQPLFSLSCIFVRRAGNNSPVRSKVKGGVFMQNNRENNQNERNQNERSQRDNKQNQQDQRNQKENRK